MSKTEVLAPGLSVEHRDADNSIVRQRTSVMTYAGSWAVWGVVVALSTMMSFPESDRSMWIGLIALVALMFPVVTYIRALQGQLDININRPQGTFSIVSDLVNKTLQASDIAAFRVSTDFDSSGDGDSIAIFTLEAVTTGNERIFLANSRNTELDNERVRESFLELLNNELRKMRNRGEFSEPRIG